MEASKDFQSFYQSTLVPVIETLEAERKKIARAVYLSVAFVIIYFMVSMSLAFNGSSNSAPSTPMDPYANQGAQPQMVYGPSSSGSGSYFIFILLAGGLGYYFWFLPKRKNLRLRFKSEVIGKMVKFVDENLNYKPEQGMARGEFLESHIFLSAGDRFTSEDLVTGRIGNTEIRFAEVRTERRDDEGRRNAQYQTYDTLFRGILFKADFNKNFNGRTVVLTDQAEKAFGGLGTFFQKMNQMRDPLIKMDDVNFEKAFAVYGTDPVEAHYLLSPSLMERILNFKSKLGKIELSFVDSHLYVAIPTRQNLFESRLFSSIVKYPKLETYHHYLQSLAGMVEDLNLNTRIWTKE
ncbi:MAG TPA: hypothetical protein DGG95_13840 [Cytophagales bacterium]|jgi:hypothetical protein|nr:hypothetical protein [Cytophagales bacterium]